MRSSPIRLILADELALVRAGLRRLLEDLASPKLEVLAETGDGQELLELVSRLRPDLVITDIALQKLSGLEALQQIRRHYPEVAVLFLSARSEPTQVRQAMQQGACGYLAKDAEPDELGLALRAHAKGQHYLSPKVSGAAFERGPRRGEESGVLTARQRQVLRLMARGKTTKEIAALMGVSVKTVETHRARMAQSLGLYGVNALLRYAIRLGFEQGDVN
ncbi:MAG: response regulator transcription factor [Stagnimonas sp.]|nr:response regulator transcription factor [Stagnimonas sp.]